MVPLGRAISRMVLIGTSGSRKIVRSFSTLHFHGTSGDRPKMRYFSTVNATEPKAIGASAGDSRFRRQVSLTSVLRGYGFSSSVLSQFLQRNRFLLDLGLDHLDVQRSIGVLLSFGLSQDALVSVVSSCPRVLELSFMRMWHMAFCNLGFSTVPALLVQRILEHSLRCHIEPRDVQRNLQVLREAGFCDKTIIRVLEELPAACFSLRGINFNTKFLMIIGLSMNEIDRLTCSYPGFLALSSESRLQPLFEEFDELGVSIDELRKAVVKNPRVVLSMETGEPSRLVDLLRSLGCRLPIKEKILHEGLISSVISVKLRVDFLCGYGLIHRDAFRVLWKEPRIILYSLDDIEKKIEFLIHNLGFGIDWLVEVPEYLGVNLEKQVIPRYNVIEYLRSKDALGFQVDLKHLIRPSRMKFYNMFVKPYPECENIFGGLLRDVKIKSKHPVGLWTLFKPPTYSQSREDMQNMKAFMESLV